MPEVPGLTLGRPLSAGSQGPPWRAKDARSGYDVVVRPLPVGSDPTALAAALEHLPEHPHLLRPSMSIDAAGRPVLVTRHARHGGLDALVRRRGGLSPAEVVTVAMAVGRALATLHAGGLAHGLVRAGSVVIGTEARPFVDSTPMLLATVPAADAEGDVVALAELLRSVVEAPVPPAMTEMLLAAAERDPALPATELVRRLVAVCPPEPLRLAVPPVATVTRPASMRGRLSALLPRLPSRTALPAGLGRRLIVGCSVVVALAGSVGAGLVWERVSDRPPIPGRAAASTPAVPVPRPTVSTLSSTPAPSPVDWAGLLSSLDERRGEAFAQGDAAALTDVDAPGSAVLAADLAALRALSAAGVHASGFRQVLRSVRPVSVTAARVVLTVVDERPAYSLVRAGDGAVVTTRAARASKSWQVELLLGDAGWQVGSVRAAPG